MREKKKSYNILTNNTFLPQIKHSEFWFLNIFAVRYKHRHEESLAPWMNQLFWSNHLTEWFSDSLVYDSIWFHDLAAAKIIPVVHCKDFCMTMYKLFLNTNLYVFLCQVCWSARASWSWLWALKIWHFM